MRLDFCLRHAAAIQYSNRRSPDNQSTFAAIRKGMRMLKKILIGLGICLLLFIVVVALQPADFRISRSATVAAPPAVVFEQVNDFHKWEAWSPWAKLDPSMKQTFEGAASGNGAVYTWAGNDQVGEGRMTITESRPGELVRIDLEFLKPFAARNVAEFTFKAGGAQTAVTWTMTGQNNFMGKAFQLFVNMDKLVGGDFEKGLAQMKTAAEAAHQQQAPATPATETK